MLLISNTVLVPFFRGTPYDYQYNTERNQRAYGAMDGQFAFYPRGKVLGGTPMLNYMLYVRGHRKDYDEWESLGNTGWGYKDLLPLFKKSESYDKAGEDDLHRGRHGKLSIEESKFTHTVGEILLEAIEQAGFPKADLNGASQNQGIFEKPQLTSKNGWRLSTYQSFVKPLLDNPKLKLDVVSYAFAKKLVISDSEDSVQSLEVEKFASVLSSY